HRGLIDDRATSDVHDPRVRLHAPDDVARYGAPRCGGERRRDGEVIGLSHDLGEMVGGHHAIDLDARFRWSRLTTDADHAHPGGACKASDLAADAAHAVHHHRRAAELLVLQLLPFARPL